MHKMFANHTDITLEKNRNIFQCADYPYYRDLKENWEDRLKKLKNIGVNTITCYIPWRFHLLNRDKNEFDFRGVKQDNTDLNNFLEICEKMKLFVMIKPGPFIHAEVNYGGLPDYFNSDEFEGMVNYNGSPNYYEKKNGKYVLPSPFSDKFLDEMLDWYQIVFQNIKEHFYPQGSIVGIQLLNEGIFSDANSLFEKWDYSQSAMNKFCKYLQAEYGTIHQLNQILHKDYQTFEDIVLNREEVICTELRNDFVKFQSNFLIQVYERLRDVCPKDVYLFANFNSPQTTNQSICTWLSKIRPEKLKGIQYGYTSWGGNLLTSKEAFLNYLLLVKRYLAMNMECNWGFSKLYEKEYESAVVPFYEVVLSLANGAIGYNVYTGVGTEYWDDELDNIYDRPYPDCSPISEKGTYNESKSAVINMLNQYLVQYGSELLSSTSKKESAYFIFEEDYYSGCWNDSEHEVFKEKLYWFMHNMLHYHYDFDIVDSSNDNISLKQYKYIFTTGCSKRNELIEEKLITYLKEGGIVISLGEELKKNKFFMDKVIELGVSENVNFIDGEIQYRSDYFSTRFFKIQETLGMESDIVSRKGNHYTWCLNNMESDTKHIFVFSSNKEIEMHELQLKYGSQQFTMRIFMPGMSVAMIRLKENKITSFIIKCVNDLLNQKVKPQLSYNGFYYELPDCEDVLVMDD